MQALFAHHLPRPVYDWSAVKFSSIDYGIDAHGARSLRVLLADPFPVTRDTEATIEFIDKTLRRAVDEIDPAFLVSDEDARAERYLLIEICQRQFGGDKWDRYTVEYLAEVAERAIEQAHAHAINEDADREEYRAATRDKNLEILTRVSPLGARYLSLFDDATIADGAAAILAAQEDEARKENERRDRARSGPLDFLFSLPVYPQAFRNRLRFI